MTSGAAEIPAHVRRFNWAAFLCPVLWSLAAGPRIWALAFFVGGLVLSGRLVWAGVMPWLVMGAGINGPPLQQSLAAIVVGIAFTGLQVWYGFRANALLWESSHGTVDWGDAKRIQRVIVVGVLLLALVAGLFSALLFAASRYPALDKLIFMEGPPL